MAKPWRVPKGELVAAYNANNSIDGVVNALAEYGVDKVWVRNAVHRLRKAGVSLTKYKRGRKSVTAGV